MREVRVTEAVFSKGVLTPTDRLPLRENERVRVIVQSLNGETAAQRQAAVDRLETRAARVRARSSGPYLTRDELHEG